MSKLSVIIVTKNEAHNIEDCLKSISFADEIVIFDSGSTDNTVDICKQFTQKVTVTSDWPGDGPQKNRALAQVSNDWVLCLDADERITPALGAEIQAIIAKTSHAAFDIPYQSTYCGKIIRFGDWKGESHIRLFNRQVAKITPDIVHCRVETSGSIGKLQAAIIHHPFHHLGALLHKMNDYSTQSAKALLARGNFH
jgi:glycosyltransferase involved in cell wall biosynthesis